MLRRLLRITSFQADDHPLRRFRVYSSTARCQYVYVYVSSVHGVEEPLVERYYLSLIDCNPPKGLSVGSTSCVETP